MFLEDTISAIATPPGEGGIGIIRISGPMSKNIANEIFKPFYRNNIDEYAQRTLVYGNIVDCDEIIDEVLITFMKGPNSYTAEDVVEINCHGGFISTRKILELTLKKGARLAEAGEFTKRAFLNGRIDLSQAEAVIDVINAKTEKSHELAQNQLKGALSRRIKSMRDRLLDVLTQIEVAIDYPEEDIEFITYKELEDKVNSVYNDIVNLENTADTGKILREGISTAILGKPNVGKSSLLNYLLGENRAIVTDIPGTTRDVIEEYINIGGIALKVVDTAGIRDTDDVVEKIGVEKSKQYMDSSDLSIVVIDSSRELDKDDIDILECIDPDKTIVVLNKMDLERKIDMEVIYGYIDRDYIINISAIENEGIESLYEKIQEMVFSGGVSNTSEICISNTRHRDAIYRARISIEEAIKALGDNLPYDFVEVDIRDAWTSLGFINGDTATEELLDNIFKNFCIGK